MKKKLLSCFAVFLIGSQVTIAEESTESQLLSAIVVLSPLIVPAFIFSESAELIVEGVKIVGKSTEIVIKSLATPSKGSILVAGHLSYAAGQSVETVTTSAGHILSIAGKVVAFIPNKIGKSLIYQAKH